VSPLNAHAGTADIVVVKLSSAGAYQWHTFYGSTSVDEAFGIAVDSSANIYVADTAVTPERAGSIAPLNAYAGDMILW